MQFFTKLGVKLDTAIALSLKAIGVRRPQPSTKPKTRKSAPDYPEVMLSDGVEEYPAYFIRRDFSPSIHTPVDITNNDALSQAMEKAGYTWNPQLRLVDEGESYDVDYDTLKKDSKE